MSSLTPNELAEMADVIADQVAERLSRQPRLLDRHGLAEHLGVSVPTVDRLRASGRITPVMVGNRPMYAVDDVIRELREAKK